MSKLRTSRTPLLQQTALRSDLQTEFRSIFSGFSIREHDHPTGFIRIRECLAKEAPELEMNISSDSSGFWVTIGKITETTKPTNQAITPPITPPITDAEMKMLRLLEQHPEYSASMLAKELAIGRDTAKEYLGRLKAKGVLAREGTARSGRWIVIDNKE